MPRSVIVAVLLVLIAAAVGALYWYSRTMTGISMGGPVPLRSIPPPPRTVATAVPVSPSPLPSIEASANAAASPVASQAPASAPATTGPRIFRVSLSSPEVSGGQVVTGTVQTTPDVTAVSAQIMGYSSPLTKVSTGYFALSYQVPTLPQFLRRTYTIVVTATDAQGRSASSSLPIRVR